jgi:hypothetical protein
MTIRNRELSQFGSFIYITDDTRNIAITTESTPFVGIGTTNPQRKLHVVGDIQIDGDLFYQGNLQFGNIDLNTTGIITASAFFNPEGDQLTGFDSWSKTNSTIYRLSNVGIGTINPLEKLDVLGNVRTSGQFISSITGTFTTGTAPLDVLSRRLVTNLNSDYLRGGELGGAATGDVVSVGGNQNLTNKTLTNPTVSGSINFGTATLSGPASGTYEITLPAESGTLVTSGSGVISGLVTTGNIQNGTILNEDIANGTIQNAKLANSSISGVSLGSNLNNLTAGSFITYSSGSTYNGSAAITIATNGTSSNIGNTLVARNASGDFSAGTVSVLNLTATQTVQAQDFNSTSDENLKENINTYENALETLHNLRGVSFTWKETQKPSIGVIAQELEKVLPQLVNDGAVKSVNYNGIIGVLIEAVKELSEEVRELKKHINN